MSGDVRFGALDRSFAVSTDDADVAAYLRRWARHLPPAGAHADRHYVVTTTDGSIQLLADGEPHPAASTMPALRALIRDVNDDLIVRSRRLLIHAAAAERDGRGVALAGVSGSGKSTLVAALVRAGYGYLTDEFVSPDWDTGVVERYARFISLDPGSWAPFRELEPNLPGALGPLLAGQWQVDPEDIRPQSVAEPCRLGVMVFTTFAADSPTGLEPMRRADALRELVNHTFHFHAHGGRALELLGNVVADCDCYRLSYSDVDVACDLIGEIA